MLCVFKKGMAHFLNLGDFMVEILKSKLIISQKTQLCIGQSALTSCSICATQHTSSVYNVHFATYITNKYQVTQLASNAM
jgi:hypothetical protein